MNEIDKLKKLEAPLWSRILGSFRAWNRARRARYAVRYVCTICMWVKSKEVDYCYDVLCFERGDGKRFTKNNFPWWVGVRSQHTYNHAIVPWLHGFYSNNEIRAVAAHSYVKPTNWVSK